LPTATENYVPQLLALAIIINDPSRYDITLPTIPNKPLVGSAPIPQQMSLSQAAKFAGIGEDELKALNPGFTHNVTPPPSAGIHHLMLPLNSVITFEENCAANPGVTGLERYTVATTHARPYGVYKVHRGDTLSTVSRFTGISVATLKNYNHLKTTLLHTGQVLKYPVNQTDAYHYITYHVKPGDSLERIAKKYHVNTFDLMQWNNLSQHNTLHVGERMVIRQKITY
jgi:membrane-bound lytic murein transglycosylase D